MDQSLIPAILQATAIPVVKTAIFSDQVIIAFLTGFFPIVSTILTFYLGFLLKKQGQTINKLEQHTNGMQSELLKLTGEKEYSKGIIQGKAEERDDSKLRNEVQKMEIVRPVEIKTTEKNLTEYKR